MSSLFNPSSGHLRTLIAGGNIQITESSGALTISAFGAGGASNAVPAAGQPRQVLTKNSGLDYDYSWVSEPYLLYNFTSATAVTAGQILLIHKFAAGVIFPANFGVSLSNELSGCDSLVNATSSTTLTISTCIASADPTVIGNWTSVGTIIFAAGGHTGTFASSGGTTVSVGRGDRLKIVASTTDATLSNIAISLVGDR